MKRIIVALSLGALLFSPYCANAQLSPGWNIKARELSQAAASRAVTALNDGHPKAATLLLQKAIKDDPENPRPYETLGLSLAMEGSYAEALDSLQKAYSLQPSNETLLSTGIVYYLQHDYDAAINAWSKALQANPKLCHVYGNLGMASLRKGDLKGAAELFRKLVRCSPSSELGYFGLALTDYMSGNFTAARQEAERAAALNLYPANVLLMAQIDIMLGDRTRAKKRALQFMVARRRKNQERSLAELGFPPQHAFHWDPYLVDHFDNGLLLLSRSATDPKMRDSLAGSGHVQTVIADIQKELTRAPGDLYLTQQLAMAQMAAGDYSSAAENLQSVLHQCPACSADLLHLGRALSLDGKGAEGSEKVREFQSRVPRQEVSSLFTEPAVVDPGLQADSQAQKRLPVIRKPGPKPVPSQQF